MAYDLADPLLAQFLRQQIRADAKLTYDYLAQRSADLFGAKGCLSAATINQWVDVPTLLSKEKAHKLLRLTGLEEAWSNLERTSPHALKRSGNFDYFSRTLGTVREMDLDAALADGISAWQIAENLVDIDVSLFSQVGLTETIGTPQDWHDVMVAHPDTWRVFVNDDGRVLGYWFFVCPKREIFLEACFGNYPEDKITVDTLRDIKSGPVNIYGPGIYTRKDILGIKRDKDVLGANLQLSFLYNLRRLEASGVHFSEICIPVYSEFGLNIVRKFELQRMPDDVSTRYAAEMRWVSDHPHLPALYHGWVDDGIRRRAGLLPAAPQAAA